MRVRISENQIIGFLRESNAGLTVGLHTESAHDLSEGEVALLREGGLNPETEFGFDPLAETAAAFAALLQTSLSTPEAAALLGVRVSRIRKMLTAQASLYGFQVNGRWRIPVFQFTEAGLVPNIGQVNTELDRSLHPVAVYRWYTSPDPELDVEGVVLSPLAWPNTGHDAGIVRRIAADVCGN